MPVLLVALIWMMSATAVCAGAPLVVPSAEVHTQSDAQRFNQHAKGALAPAYPYLAEFVVERYRLAETPGIGIDLGSGPGDAIVELARRTPAMYWINADINPHHFRYFFSDAVQAGLAHRVGAVFADAQRLPFRDDYADVVISRGSFQFWEDPIRAFAEILRILKPGGRALIGRGLAPNTPVEIARQIRDGQSGGPQYDLGQTEALFRKLMAELIVQEYEIVRPRPEAEVNYGIWIDFAKPSGGMDDE